MTDSTYNVILRFEGTEEIPKFDYYDNTNRFLNMSTGDIVRINGKEDEFWVYDTIWEYNPASDSLTAIFVLGV